MTLTLKRPLTDLRRVCGRQNPRALAAWHNWARMIRTQRIRDQRHDAMQWAERFGL